MSDTDSDTETSESEELEDEVEEEEEYGDIDESDVPAANDIEVQEIDDDPLADVVLEGKGRIKYKKGGCYLNKYLIWRKASKNGTCRLMSYKNRKAAEKDKKGNQGKLWFTARQIDDVAMKGKNIHIQVDEYEDVKMKLKNAGEWMSILECQCSADVVSGEQTNAYLAENHMCDVSGEVSVQVDDEVVSVWQDGNIVLCWPLSRILYFGHFSEEVLKLDCAEGCQSLSGTFEFETEECETPYDGLRDIYETWEADYFEDPKNQKYAP